MKNLFIICLLVPSFSFAIFSSNSSYCDKNFSGEEELACSLGFESTIRNADLDADLTLVDNIKATLEECEGLYETQGIDKTYATAVKIQTVVDDGDLAKSYGAYSMLRKLTVKQQAACKMGVRTAGLILKKYQ